MQGAAQTVPLEDNPSPVISFLADPQGFQDCCSDFTFFAGDTRAEFAASCDQIREVLFDAQEARENGTTDANYCLQLMDLMLGNIERSLEGAA